eukprot:RCo019804
MTLVQIRLPVLPKHVPVPLLETVLKSAVRLHEQKNGGKTTAKLLKVRYCSKKAKACLEGKTPIALPENIKFPDEPFLELTEEELKLEDMQASMKAAGLSGTMYRRDDLEGLDPEEMAEEDL